MYKGGLALPALLFSVFFLPCPFAFFLRLLAYFFSPSSPFPLPMYIHIYIYTLRSLNGESVSESCFFWYCVFSSANRHSPFAISCFDFLNASQNFLNASQRKMDERNVYSSRDKQHHSSFTIRFVGKWMRQGLEVDITIRHSLFLILQLGCPVHAPFIQ